MRGLLVCFQPSLLSPKESLKPLQNSNYNNNNQYYQTNMENSPSLSSSRHPPSISLLLQVMSEVSRKKTKNRASGNTPSRKAEAATARNQESSERQQGKRRTGDRPKRRRSRPDPAGRSLGWELREEGRKGTRVLVRFLMPLGEQLPQNNSGPSQTG